MNNLREYIPWIGSYIPLTLDLPSGIPLKLALGSNPRLPGITLASSLIISPNRLLVTMMPFSARGFFTISIAAESMRWWPNFSCGYSFSMTCVNTFRHSRLVASTFALSRLHTGAGGSSANASCAANRVTRSISGREYGSMSYAVPSPSSSFRSPK